MSKTLEQAIEHAEEVANQCMAKSYKLDGDTDTDYLEQCAAEHRQLAEWLSELHERRKQPEIIYCKDCKWWYKYSSSWNCKKYYYCARESITATVKTENDFCSKAERKINGD